MEKDKFTIKDLDLFYGDFQALKKISMHIPEKEITAFIGPSGCGKSTLLKSLNRMNDLVEGCKITGTLLLDGEPINQMKNVNLLRKRVGMVFQKPNPFPMSIYDNVAYGPRTHGIRKKSELDAIVEVLLMDEPTSALDPISTTKIEDLALELKKQYTIVMVTHNMQQAARISDKTAFFLLGEMVEMNDTETIFSKPKDKRTDDYITGRFG